MSAATDPLTLDRSARLRRSRLLIVEADDTTWRTLSVAPSCS